MDDLEASDLLGLLHVLNDILTGPLIAKMSCLLQLGLPSDGADVTSLVISIIQEGTDEAVLWSLYYILH